MRADAVSVLGRILPLAATVGRGVRTLGLVGLAATVAIALVILVRWTPGDREDWAGFGVLCVLLVVPVAVLFAFSLVLGEVVELPDKLPAIRARRASTFRSSARSPMTRSAANGPPGGDCRGARGGLRRLCARPGACSRRMRPCFRSSTCRS